MVKNKQQIKKVDLFIIDPQNDFCNPQGSLFVSGADEDMKRLSKFIERMIPYLNDIHVTMDCHRKVDVAHPIYWIDNKGKHPNPFTIISEDDVVNGKWMTTNPIDRQRGINYVKALKTGGRFPLCIWPYHCLIGTPGNNIYSSVMEQLMRWEDQFANVDFVTKGSNPYTEHYSALKAEVPDPSDPSTLLNEDLIIAGQQCDIILLTGEALSHCVANTVRDLVKDFGTDQMEKVHLLIDTTSSVPGFEQMGQDFLNEMTTRGMKTVKSTDFYI